MLGVYPAVLAGSGSSNYVVNGDACLAGGARLVAADDGGWHLFSIDGRKLMLMIMRHEEKKKWKRYRLKSKFPKNEEVH